MAPPGLAPGQAAGADSKRLPVQQPFLLVILYAATRRLYSFVRVEDLKSAGSSIVAFEAWLDGGEAENGEVGDAILRSIAEYNRDDVVSNWKLRDWLELRRVDLAKKLGRIIPRPPEEPEAKDPEELDDRTGGTGAA